MRSKPKSKTTNYHGEKNRGSVYCNFISCSAEQNMYLSIMDARACRSSMIVQLCRNICAASNASCGCSHLITFSRLPLHHPASSDLEIRTLLDVSASRTAYVVTMEYSRGILITFHLIKQHVKEQMSTSFAKRSPES